MIFCKLSRYWFIALYLPEVVNYRNGNQAKIDVSMVIYYSYYKL
jgi:hypothetical protein